jgi:hypothetical protein
LRTAAVPAQSLSVIERGGTADEIFVQVIKVSLKARIPAGRVVGHDQFVQRAGQRLGDIASPKGTESPGGIRYVACGVHGPN